MPSNAGKPQFLVLLFTNRAVIYLAVLILENPLIFNDLIPKQRKSFLWTEIP